MTKVYLIGSGPGDPTLLTLKALSIIKQADVVLYDFLVHPTVLSYCKETCDIHCVGKKRGQHSTTQDTINQMMITAAKAGKLVVRLKGGDPFIFGRAGEELDALIEANIPFECVPGVSSAIAVPEYAGIPLTHRNLSRSVAFVTGTLKKGETHLDIPEADTLVFLMALHNIDALQKKLLSLKKFHPHTKAAIITQGTSANQQIYSGTLETIAELKAQVINPSPALVVIGDVVALSDRYNWVTKKPLFSKRILLTRPKGQNDTLAEDLQALGADVIITPTITINPIPSTIKQLTKKLIAKQSDIIFTSKNSVDIVMTHLLNQGIDCRHLAHCHIHAIGQKTAEALKTYGLIANQVAKIPSQEGLIELFNTNLNKRNILIPIAKEGRTVIKEECEKRGATVTQLSIYEQRLKPNHHLTLNHNDIILLSSASIAKAFIKSFKLPKGLVFLAYGNSTMQVLNAHKLSYISIANLSASDIQIAISLSVKSLV